MATDPVVDRIIRKLYDDPETDRIVTDPVLQEADPETLLDALLRLTHSIGSEGAARREAKARGWIPEAARHLNAERDLRAQRDLVRAEILRRMGTLR